MSQTVQAPKGNLAGVPINSLRIGPGGPRSLFLGLFDFSVNTSWAIDVNKAETGLKIENPQSIFFDNSQGNAAVTLIISNTQQTLVLPPQSAGYLPILAPEEMTLQITGSSGKCGIHILSVPSAAQVWSTAAGGATTVTAAQGLPNVAAEAWPVYATFGGTAVSAANPLPVAIEGTVAMQGVVSAIQSGVWSVTQSGAWAFTNTMITGSYTLLGSTTAPAGGLASLGLVANPAALPAYTAGQYRVSLYGLDGRLLVNDTALAASIAPATPAAATATKAILNGAVYNAAPTEWATGQQGAVQGNAYGALQVTTDGLAPTYSTSGQATLPASSAAGYIIGYLQGSATKTLRLRRVMVTAVNGTASASMTFAIQRGAGATVFAGGAPNAFTAMPHDINDATSGAAGATFTAAVTAHPTINTGFIRLAAIPIPFAANVSSTAVFDFGTNTKPLIIRGTQDYIVFTLQSIVNTNPDILYIDMEWDEI